MDEMFDKIKISIASDEDIRNWSYGEVKKPETINYRTLKPEKDGLFCEKIFGPTKDWECHCGKYKKVRYKGIICDRCGVEITKKTVRRERMGHIELAAPIAHIWFFKGIPNRIALMLDVSPKALERVIYFAAYIITESTSKILKVGEILSETEYIKAKEEFADEFVAETGAEALEKLLKRVNLEALEKQIKTEILNASAGKKGKLLKRLETVEAFKKSKNKPESMIKNVIPVIPPDLRPMVQLDGGRFATSDLNELYRRVINRNNRLRRLLELRAPNIIIKNEKRMLQEAVDALMDNSKRANPIMGANSRPLKSLSELLKGKQGRFRQNLLGKRVDYSGRSVIVVGPELKLYECGLPKGMAIELFKPFIMKELIENNIAQNPRAAKKMVEFQSPEIWAFLEKVIKDHPILLNRAPTLHRLGFQAFQPVIVEGNAIKLHPLVCTAFNADFDGDQMAVHVPLSPEAQAEARYLMLGTHNLLKPSNGKPIATPSQDMVLGAYYLTLALDGEKGEGKVFKDKEEALMAYAEKQITLQSKIKVRMFNEEDESKIIDTTLGRIIFNEGIPQDLGYVDRTNPETKFDLEISFLTRKKDLNKIISRIFKNYGLDRTAVVLDFLKDIGYKYSTVAGYTIAFSDIKVPETKSKIIKEAEEKVDMALENYKMGLLSNEDRYNEVIKVWKSTKEKMTEEMQKQFTQLNPIFIMSDSGARGDINQLTQIAGMRGLMSDTTGKEIEIPIKSSLAEGVEALEYFIGAHGTRKGRADTALHTSESGYLTRRLVDVAQYEIVREYDCGTTEGVEIFTIEKDGRIIETLEQRLIGRYLVEDLVDEKTNKIIISKEELITEDLAKKIVDLGITKINVRSVIKCKCKNGTCQKCYGKSLTSEKVVGIGETVGIVGAQAIGEPGTQLTMRTFHSGGTAGGDITQGLPRIEEIFEARKPKGLGIISEIEGDLTIKFDEEGNKNPELIVKGEDGQEVKYIASKKILKNILTQYEEDNKKPIHVEKGEILTEGSLNINDIMATKGVNEVYNYMISELQFAYVDQGIDINDKHIEIIIKQMTNKVKIIDAGDTEYVTSNTVNKNKIEEINQQLIAEGKKPATYKPLLLGITKAAVSIDSFLSAASFQETTKVLTDAAVKGKVDELLGLKENVIIGRLIPAGTGLAKYRDLTTNTALQDEALAKIRALKEKEESLHREEMHKKTIELVKKQYDL